VTALAVAALIGATVGSADAASQTKTGAGSCASVSGVGTIAWGTPTNAQGIGDDAYAATGTLPTNGSTSHYLQCTGFGFTIPAGSTILGIQVEWERQNSSNGAVQDNQVKIIKGGALGTVDKALAVNWPSGDAFQSYGGAADLWGIANWTVTDVNASNFGAALSAKRTSGGSNTPNANVDSARVTVTYSQCGNASVEGAEVCDDGANNGTAGSCCSGTCTFKSNGTACTDDGNVCTLDQCNGASATCQHPAGNAGTTCRTSTGECDPAEVCTGAATTCPADALTPNGTSCSSDGNVCTLDQCNGASGTCQHPAGNAGTTCRTSTGECDPAEVCTGAATTCPADALSPAGTS
jgi:hypothetical protein